MQIIHIKIRLELSLLHHRTVAERQSWGTSPGKSRSTSWNSQGASRGSSRRGWKTSPRTSNWRRTTSAESRASETFTCGSQSPHHYSKASPNYITLGICTSYLPFHAVFALSRMEPRRALLQTANKLQNQRWVNETQGRADIFSGPVGEKSEEWLLELRVLCELCD